MIYIRFGLIPEDERSKEFYRGEYIKTLDGVSVYNVFMDNGIPQIVLPNPCNEGSIDTIHGLLIDAIAFGKGVFIVEGNEIGIGSDGEPLIRNVKITEDVTKCFSYIAKTETEADR